MQAMLLAAGLGTRLAPLTDHVAKPAVPFLGVPVVRTLALQLQAAGFTHIVANLHYRPESVRSALSGLPVTFSFEAAVLGTAGGIGAARDRGLLRADEPLLVVNAKLCTDLDFADVARAHVTSDTAVSMVLAPNRERAAFREVHVAGDRVRGFGEGRVPTGPDPLLFTGVHMLSPEVLRALPATPSDTVADVYPRLIARNEVRADVRAARWWELSTPERYLGLHLRARRLGWPERVPRGHIDPSALVHESVLWDDVEVGANARLDRCIVLAGARVPAGFEARCAIIERSPEAAAPRPLDPALIALAAGS